MGKIRKLVLAYSGGLDTSVIIKWLQDKYQCEVIAFVANIGQGEELEPLREKALRSGASKIYIEDLRKDFVEDYLFRLLKAGSIYESRYLLGTSVARPLIAKKQVEIAEKEEADAVAHGCTGKGNDQVRFELTYRALNPRLRVIAPWREWELRSREEEIEYARKHNIPIPVTPQRPYSMDSNLWHMSFEGGILEDPWQEPPEDIFRLTVSPEKAPDKVTYVEIDFEKGIPRKVDDRDFSSVSLMEYLNELGGKNGIGRVDMVENRVVGMKSRGVYETPGGTILYVAHQALESITIDRETMHYKEMVAQKYAELIYYGLWFSPLKKSIDAFIDSTQENVTGTVRLKLYKGNCTVVGRKSPYSLYHPDLATFGAGELYRHKDAEGFINLFGLPLWVQGWMKIKK